MRTNDASGNISLLVIEIQSQIAWTVNDIENLARLFEANSVAAGKVLNVFDVINSSIAAIDRYNQELYTGLKEFTRAKDNITDAFGIIEDSTKSCLSYSEQALGITLKQTEDVLQLKEFTQSLDILSGELDERLESFQAYQ